MISVVIIFLLTLPVVLLLETYNFFAEELETISVFMDVNAFRRSPIATGKKSRFIVFQNEYRFNEMDDLRTNELNFLRIENWTNGGRYYITKDGFPERVGSFVLDGEDGRWKITLTPVVGKVNLYRLK